jgi:hypothetical protein
MFIQNFAEDVPDYTDGTSQNTALLKATAARIQISHCVSILNFSALQGPAAVRFENQHTV